MNDGWRPPVLLVSALLNWDLDTLCLGNLLAVCLVTIAIGGGRGGEADVGARGPPPGLALLGGDNATLVTRNLRARCLRDLKLMMKLIKIHFWAVRSMNLVATALRLKALIMIIILHQIMSL